MDSLCEEQSQSPASVNGQNQLQDIKVALQEQQLEESEQQPHQQQQQEQSEEPSNNDTAALQDRCYFADFSTAFLTRNDAPTQNSHENPVSVEVEAIPVAESAQINPENVAHNLDSDSVKKELSTSSATEASAVETAATTAAPTVVDESGYFQQSASSAVEPVEVASNSLPTRGEDGPDYFNSGFQLRDAATVPATEAQSGPAIVATAGSNHPAASMTFWHEQHQQQHQQQQQYSLDHQSFSDQLQAIHPEQQQLPQGDVSQEVIGLHSVGNADLQNQIATNEGVASNYIATQANQANDNRTLVTPESMLAKNVDEAEVSAEANIAASVVSKVKSINDVYAAMTAPGCGQFSQLECGLCGQVFTEVEALAQHLGDAHLAGMRYLPAEQTGQISGNSAKLITPSALVCCLRLDLRVDNELEPTSYRSHLSGRETGADTLSVVTTRDPDGRLRPVFECRRCQRMFPSRHECLKHTDCVRFKCNYCDYVCPNASAKAQHEKKRHSGSATAGASGTASAGTSTGAATGASALAGPSKRPAQLHKGNKSSKASAGGGKKSSTVGKRARISGQQNIITATESDEFGIAEHHQQQQMQFAQMVDSSDVQLQALLLQQQQQQQQQQHDQAMQAYQQMVSYGGAGFDPQQQFPIHMAAPTPQSQYELAAYHHANAYALQQQQQQQQQQYYYPHYHQLYEQYHGQSSALALATAVSDGEAATAYYAMGSGLDEESAQQQEQQQQQQQHQPNIISE